MDRFSIKRIILNPVDTQTKADNDILDKIKFSMRDGYPSPDTRASKPFTFHEDFDKVALCNTGSLCQRCH